jgi:hypothetical protein
MQRGTFTSSSNPSYIVETLGNCPTNTAQQTLRAHQHGPDENFQKKAS